MTGLTPDETRGWAARLLLAEDARWIGDIVYSSRADEDSMAYPALLLGHHFVRIVYEGSKALRSPKAEVGWPPLAAHVKDQYAAVTARARHVTKLLDDTKKSYHEVLAEIREAQETSHRVLTGNSHPWFRWAETDLGLYMIDRHVVGATVPMAYRLGLAPGNQELISGEDLHAVTQEWGGTVAALAVAALNTAEIEPTISFAPTRVSSKVRLASRYLAGRYEREFADEVKLLLLMIEGDLNTNRLYLSFTETGHEGPCLRARVVTVYHSLTALHRVLDKHPTLDTAGTRSIRDVLADPAAQRLLSRDGKMVRNRSVHYQMDDPTILPDLSRPMFGIIEAVAPGFTWETLHTDVRTVEDRLAAALAAWVPANRRRA